MSLGFLIAYGANKRMRGIDIADLKDIDGKFYVRRFVFGRGIRVARSQI